MDINNNSTSNKNGGRPVRVDWGVIVRNRVLRATQNPLYSVMREEVTRHSNSLFEHCCAGHGAPVLGMTTDARNELPFFPFNNARSSDTTVLSSEPSSQECVALIGGTGFYGKFLAEQYLNRGINVTVLARDADKARSIFLPIVDGEREAAEQRSKGMLSLIPQASRPEQLSAEHCVDDGRSAKRVLRYRYKTASTHAVAAGPDVTLEIVEGDVNAKEDLEYAMRGATLVYYLVSALPQHPTAGVRGWFSSSFSWWSSDRTAAAAKTSGDNEEDVAAATPASYGGFLRAFDVCRRVDAHFVALTPMWIHGSRLSPFYWHRRLTHPWGYSKAVRQEELTMLEQRGAPARRCYFGATEDADEEPRMWRYWWSILRSTKLPEDRAELHRSPVRFTLFRLSDIVYPSFNQHMAVVKNNRVNDATHMDSISSGNLDARLLAGVMSKTLALCRSVSESRIDVAGRLKGDVDMTDTAAVLDMFNTLRNE